MSTRGKRTLWVTEAKTVHHLERAKQLTQFGYEVIFLSEINELVQITEESRPSNIIIDTRSSTAETENLILAIGASPNLSASRVLLNLIRPDEIATKLAMAGNFRDILPWNIPSDAWITRFQYATAPRPLDIPQDLCAISINQMAVLRMPSRLVWINETHMRIECRGTQRPGTTLHVTGRLAAAFGVPHIALSVESVHRDRLLYRFSQAIEARWSIPSASIDRALALIRRLQLDNAGPRIRAFVAINRDEWRKSVLEALNTTHYEVNVALRRANLSSEVTYFSPDVVFMDDRVASNLKDDEIVNIFTRIATDVPLIVFGDQFDAQRLKNLLNGRPFYQESKLDAGQLGSSMKRYGVKPHTQLSAVGSNVFHILPDHPWSSLELEVHARIQNISPKNGSLALPFPVGTFALARIESPLLRKSLGRDPYIKITNGAEARNNIQNPKFSYNAEFFLADVDQDGQRRISQMLVNIIADFYGKRYGYTPVTGPVPILLRQNTAVALPTPIPANAPVPEAATEPAVSPKPIAPAPEEIKARDIAAYSVRKTEFDITKYIDPVIVKAVCVFALALTIMGVLLYAATNIDQASYKDHGKEYGEFFKKMKDPSFQRSSPTPEK